MCDRLPGECFWRPAGSRPAYHSISSNLQPLLGLEYYPCWTFDTRRTRKSALHAQDLNDDARRRFDVEPMREADLGAHRCLRAANVRRSFLGPAKLLALVGSKSEVDRACRARQGRFGTTVEIRSAAETGRLFPRISGARRSVVAAAGSDSRGIQGPLPLGRLPAPRRLLSSIPSRKIATR